VGVVVTSNEDADDADADDDDDETIAVVDAVSVVVLFVSSSSSGVIVFVVLLSEGKKPNRQEGHSFSRCTNNHCRIHSSWNTCAQLRDNDDDDDDAADVDDFDHMTESPTSKLSIQIGQTSSSSLSS